MSASWSGSGWKASAACRGKRLHNRNQHLRNNRGFSVASSNGLSVAFSSGISCFMLQRIVTCPVDLLLELANGFSVTFPMESHLCEIWCVIV